MAEYSKLAKGTLVSNGAANYVNLPFQPEFVEFINFTAATTPAVGGIPFAWWDDGMGQGAAVYDVYNATPVLTTATTLSGGISTFAAGLSLQFGPSQQVVSTASSGTNTIFTVTAHGYVNGDVVTFQGLYQTPTTGLPQMAGIPFSIFNVTTNTFTVDWNTSGSTYTQLTGSPTGALVKQVLYPFLYIPGDLVIAAISAGPTPGTTNILTTVPHNYVVGQEVAFRIPAIWGPTQLNSLPDNTIPGSPVYYYVTGTPSNLVFTVNATFSLLTPFNFFVPVAATVGLTFPQVVAVGDVNSGGTPYSGGNLYPSPLVNGIPTINGPAISGAFINNTSQGFIIGPTISGASGNVLYWRAYYFDYGT